MYNTKTEIRNTFLLYKAVSELRKEYEAKKYKTVKGEKLYDMEQAYEYMYAVNRRNVITKESYFDFIGAVPERQAQIEDAHDAKVIFQDGAQELRQEIMDKANIQYTKIITTKNADLEGIRQKIKRLKKLLAIKTNSGQITSLTGAQASFDKHVADGTITRTAADNNGTDLWNEILERQAEIDELNEELKETKKAPLEVTNITKEKEFYKPYNMTRRMHVVLAFKDYKEILVDNNKSKLMVTQ